MATHYGTIAAADTYLADDAAWLALSSAQKTARLLEASIFVDSMYGDRFPGTPVGDTDRYWPAMDAKNRHGATIPSDTVPEVVELATYKAAAYEGDLMPVFVKADRLKRRKTDVLEREWFEPGAPGDVMPSLTAIDALLWPILRPTTTMSWVMAI